MWPDKAQYRPGDPVDLRAVPGSEVAISELGHPVITLPVVNGEVRWTAPAAAGHAPRGFRAEALDRQGLVVAATAFDVATHWSVAPRYGFLTEFRSDAPVEAISQMARLHLNVVQFYDWMYTHYEFFAPEAEFVDPLGRYTSHRVVRERVAECHRYGMACLAYGAIYGGEKPIAEAHPEWLLYDGNGNPFSLGGFFFIQNIEPGCGWRDRILEQFEAAVERLGFDGIQMDQYGMPKRANYHPGPGVDRVVDMTTTMPEFVAEAARRVKRLRPDGGSIFNCVNNWPIEGVAGLTEDAASYIEVWGPNDTYRDLHALIRMARALGPHKQVILAAYLSAFSPHRERPAGAMPALRLVTAAIHAAGGFHICLGEGSGVLTEAYFPEFGRLSDADGVVVQAYYDFITAYGELLHDRDLRDVSHTWGGGYDEATQETRMTGPVKFSSMAEAGKVWVLLKEKPGRRIVHLINLCGLEHSRWNSAQPAPESVAGMEIEIQLYTPVRGVWCASPDDGGAPRRLELEPASDGQPAIRFKVPLLRYWQMIWTEE